MRDVPYNIRRCNNRIATLQSLCRKRIIAKEIIKKMAIVKFRQVEERIWQRIDTIFFFRASETDKCAIPLTREDQTMQIFFHIIFHHFIISGHGKRTHKKKYQLRQNTKVKRRNKVAGPNNLNSDLLTSIDVSSDKLLNET